MKTRWLEHGKSTRLIIFCNGCGMDERPFAPIRTMESDVLMVYDYTEMTRPQVVDSLFDEYEEIHLVGWSMGVWAGQQLFGDRRYNFSSTIAINGTLSPIDDRYGIPQHVFSQMAMEYDETACHTFYRLMCREKPIIRRFHANRPARSLASQQDELYSLLKRVDNIAVDDSLYTGVCISKNDYIMPTANQHRFWRNRTILSLDGYHFPFYGWKSWDEMLESLGSVDKNNMNP